MKVSDSELEIFLIPATEGLALEQPDFSAGNRPFTGDDGVFVPV